jgi:hypothetical protein
LRWRDALDVRGPHSEVGQPNLDDNTSAVKSSKSFKASRKSLTTSSDASPRIFLALAFNRD